jgi:hypothetical protein
MPLALYACYFEVKDGCYFMAKINIFRIWQGFQVLLETTEMLDCTCAAMVLGWFLGSLRQSWTEPMNDMMKAGKLSFRFLIDLKQKQKSNCLKRLLFKNNFVVGWVKIWTIRVLCIELFCKYYNNMLHILSLCQYMCLVSMMLKSLVMEE